PAPQPVQVRKEASGMVYVAGGSFEMGNNTGRQDERPVHTVTLSAFYMAKFPVTQEQYQAVMKLNPSQFKGNKHPVEKISWREAIRYCNMLSKIEGLKPCYLTGSSGMSPDNPECDWLANGYRLPTEAEWEYAARGGVYAQKGGPVATLDLRQEGGKTNDAMHMTQAVGLAPANELGITDMLGNVNEWCWDWYMVEYYAHSIARNPIGPMQGMYKVCRGGSWKNLSMSVTTRFSFELNQFYNNVGFRVVRSG
ncbi:MAG TPA: SUMF1/EgtB/PvdO family nonheme iron enzyme, partial [Candidatus Cloacimonadota bacterium]|nr:SUMF1/EgtB/PvdO family nonheme iron enzyme [Candidatus Cloacimonadota bacterium]